MVVSEDETWTCCECDVTDQDYTRDDGLPPGWAVNIDDEPFCAACLKRRPLDPPECRDDDCPNAAALAAAQAEIAALRGALGGLVGFIDEKEMWFDAPTSVDALEARMATARALLAPEPQGGERRGGVSRDA